MSSLTARLRALHAALASTSPDASARVLEILVRFYRKMAGDLLVGFFFVGHDTDAIAAKQAEFILRAMGARASFSGKSPGQAHRGLAPILSGHFDRRLVLLRETLALEGLPSEQIETWIEFEESFRAAIVGGA